MVLLSDVTEGSVGAQKRKDDEEWLSRLDILKEELNASNAALREQIAGKDKDIEILNAAIHEKDLVLQEEKQKYENEKAQLEAEKVQLEDEKLQLEAEIETEKAQFITRICDLEKEVEEHKNVIKQTEDFKAQNSGNLNEIDSSEG